MVRQVKTGLAKHDRTRDLTAAEPNRIDPWQTR